MRFLIIAIFFVICSFVTFAQAPQAFNYQGIARDASGATLANQNIALRISILEGELPGSIVYQEIHSISTSKLGVFSIVIGHGADQLGALEDVPWGDVSHSISIEMDPTGGTDFQLMGESPLLSVPYALHAATAAKSNGPWTQNGSDLYYTPGFVGIGTTNPNHKLTILGSDNIGTEVEYLSINNTSTGNRSGVRLGLSAGNQSSQTTLGHHSETYDFQGTTYTDFGQLHSSGAGLIIRTTHEDGIIKWMTGIDGTGNSVERMRLDHEGRLGIGTTLPASRLQIADGDVFIEDINSGVIMKSPNGNCWRMTINNDGSVKTTSITCPN